MFTIVLILLFLFIMSLLSYQTVKHVFCNVYSFHFYPSRLILILDISISIALPMYGQ